MNNKKIYETIYILKGSFTEEKYKQTFEKVQNFLSRYNIEKVEEVGKRKLAYEVNKETNGYFVVVEIRATEEEIAEIERHYRITDDIIKFLIVKNIENNMKVRK